MTRAPIIAAPPLAPSSQVGWLTAAEGIDAVIRLTWQLQQRRQVSWDAAGAIHHALIEVRDGALR